MTSTLNVAPGSVVVVRDEEWLVTSVEQASDGQLVRVQGLTELVRNTSASFYEALDTITSLDPRDAELVADGSPGYRMARLWLEATLRKSPVPLTEPHLTVAPQALADSLDYQHDAVRTALDPDNLRPRILLADAVGLGKTLEIGMILAELIRRGRGDRILIVCPRHVLEQMQNEMWSRFAIPFVRLDSQGVQRVKQKIPATRNPFTYFKKVIVSMDTLKQDRFQRDLRQHRWDAVVIDESHNVTNVSTQNNRLARTLAASTDALILASATPHNGKKESFAELVRLLEPTAVTPEGELDEDMLKRLVVRRHRHSPEVARVVGSDWAERKDPVHRLVSPSFEEDAVATELAEVWLHPESRRSPYSGQGSLFGWTLAKAFLSSPAALADTLSNRLAKLTGSDAAVVAERTALNRLQVLNDACQTSSSKYDALLAQLRALDVTSTNRAVVFAERVPTLHWLQQRLTKDLRLSATAVEVLHGGLSDVEQGEIVESFKQTSSPIRVLVTGDVASEGVNLHRQCHELIHFDIPWSLIRIEQRNGRIDRYGQKQPPQISTLLLTPTHPQFSGDVRVLTRLLEKEQQAHLALGDAASLMGSYSIEAEEEAIKKVLAGQADLDDVVADVEQVKDGGGIAALMARLAAARDAGPRQPEQVTTADSLYAGDIDFLREALAAHFAQPEEAPGERGAGGVSWREIPAEQIATLQPPKDLQQRLEALPQGYLEDRRVRSELKLATAPVAGKRLLEAALSDDSDSSWPEAHYLGPLHPVLDWAADRALSSLRRNTIFAVRGPVEDPTMLLTGSLTNHRGQVVAASWITVAFPNPSNPGFCIAALAASAPEMLATVGFGRDAINPGPVAGAGDLQPLVPAAVDRAGEEMRAAFAAATQATEARIARWNQRTIRWQHDADALIQRSEIKERRLSVAEETDLIKAMSPARTLVRPLLLVLPADHPVEVTHGRL